MHNAIAPSIGVKDYSMTFSVLFKCIGVDANNHKHVHFDTFWQKTAVIPSTFYKHIAISFISPCKESKDIHFKSDQSWSIIFLCLIPILD